MSRGMKRLSQSVLAALVLLAAGLSLTGCSPSNGLTWATPCPGCSPCGPGVDCQPQAPAPAPAPMVAPAPPPPTPGVICGTLAWPTGDPRTSSILLEKCAPSMVQVGRPFDFVIKVHNLTNTTLKNVVVTDAMPASFRVSKMEPSASGGYVWNLGNLEPRAVRTITVSGMATGPGKLQNCVTVTHQLDTCLAIDVTAPQLTLTKTAPAAVLKCDPIDIKLVVTNTGVGAAEGVKIVDTLPSGMTTLDGKSSVEIPVGTLPAGKSMEYTIAAKVQRSGSYTNQAVATALGDISARASSTTAVMEPALKVTKTGPALRYVGRPIDYTISVTNTGNGEARNVMLEDAIPAGTTHLAASDDGKVAGASVVWNLGNLAPGASKRVTVQVRGNQIGTVTNTAVARAYCAADAAGSATTEIKGIPAILLECIDVEDPIEVGGVCTYVITVTNQGSSVGTNIRIDTTLEDSMQYVSADGPTQGTVNGRTITFAPLPSLAPQARQSWTVKVKALRPGDVRFHITMNSDQIQRPVQETESTNFYQ